jgi:hypothetical protein
MSITHFENWLIFIIRVVVSSIDDGASLNSFLFRSYDNPIPGALNYGPAQNFLISEVARATSAADLKFDAMIIEEKVYYDGGLGDNNPSPIILDEVLTTLDQNITNALNIFISLGTGVKTKKREKVKQNLHFVIRKHFGLIDTFANAICKLKVHGLGVERHHKDMLRYFKSGKCTKLSDTSEAYEQYARFDGGDRVGILKLDQWFTRRKHSLDNKTTQEFIDYHMLQYLAQADIIAELQRCAISLVKNRRARIAADPDKWRRFAHATLQGCPLRNCPKQLRHTKAAVIEHIKHAHPEFAEQSLIDSIKEYPPRSGRGPF